MYIQLYRELLCFVTRSRQRKYENYANNYVILYICKCAGSYNAYRSAQSEIFVYNIMHP